MSSPTDRLRGLRSRKDVADLLGVKYSTLTWALYKLDEPQQYAEFTINKKSGGTRTIHAPRKPILALQYPLARLLAEVYQPRRCVHGFVQDRSIVTNAREHSRKRH